MIVETKHTQSECCRKLGQLVNFVKSLLNIFQVTNKVSKLTIKSGASNFILEAPDKVWKVTIKSGAFNFVLEAPDKVWKVTIKSGASNFVLEAPDKVWNECLEPPVRDWKLLT